MYRTELPIDLPVVDKAENDALIRAAAAFAACYLNLRNELGEATTKLLLQNLNHLDAACSTDSLRALSKLRKLHSLLRDKQLLAEAMFAASDAVARRRGSDVPLDLLDCLDLPCYYRKDLLCVGLGPDRREYHVSAMGQHVQGAIHACLTSWLERVEQRLSLAATNTSPAKRQQQATLLPECPLTSTAIDALALRVSAHASGMYVRDALRSGGGSPLSTCCLEQFCYHFGAPFTRRSAVTTQPPHGRVDLSMPLPPPPYCGSHSHAMYWVRPCLPEEKSCAQNAESGEGLLSSFRISRLVSFVLEMAAKNSLPSGLVCARVIREAASEALAQCKATSFVLQAAVAPYTLGVPLVLQTHLVSDLCGDYNHVQATTALHFSQWSTAHLMSVFDDRNNWMRKHGRTLRQELLKHVHTHAMPKAAYTSVALDSLLLFLPIIEARRRMGGVHPCAQDNSFRLFLESFPSGTRWLQRRSGDLVFEERELKKLSPLLIAILSRIERCCPQMVSVKGGGKSKRPKVFRFHQHALMQVVSQPFVPSADEAPGPAHVAA